MAGSEPSPCSCVYCYRSTVGVDRPSSGKLLSCFHAICRDCLDNEISADTTLSCRRCSEKTKVPKQSVALLPPANVISAANSSQDGEQEQRTASSTSGGTASGKNVTLVLCDECNVTDENDALPATGQCATCLLRFCDECASSHKTRRWARHHQIVSLRETRQKEESAQPQHPLHACPLHPKHTLSLHCKPCNEVCCQRCHETGAHSTATGHHDLVNVQEQAAAIRQTFSAHQPDCSLPFSNEHDAKLSHAAQAVASTIDEVNDQTTKTSEEITAFFEGRIQVLREREKQLLSQLDKMRWEKLQKLELQKGVLDDAGKGRMLTRYAREYFTRPLSNSNELLLVSDWIEKSDSQTMTVLQRNAEPCTRSWFCFISSNRAKFTEATELLGAVADGLIELESSRMTVAQSAVSAHAPLDIKVTAQCRYTSTDLSPNMHQCIDVHVKSPGGDVAQCTYVGAATTSTTAAAAATPTPAVAATTSTPAVAAATSSQAAMTPSKQSQLTFRCQLQEQGEHLVSATLHRTGEHLPGSPAKVQVTAKVNTFDPDTSSRNILLSNSFRTAQKKVARNYDYAIGLSMMSIGVHHYRIKCNGLVDHPNNNLHIGVTSNIIPGSDHLFQKDHFSGFISDPKFVFGAGNTLQTFSARWQDDVIRLEMNCDSHILSMHNERTGEVGVITNVCNGQLPVRFAVALYLREHTITLL